MSVTIEQIDDFHRFAVHRIQQSGEDDLTMDDLLLEWDSQVNREEINQAIREGIADVDAGRTRSVMYNDGLRLESMTYPDGTVVFYGYDNATQGTIRDRAGRIAEIREANSSGQQLAAYEYMGSGRVANTEYPEPAIHQHADRGDDGVYEIWDRFGRTLQAYWRPTTGTGNNYVDRVDYGYDYVGNRTYRNVRVDTMSGASTDERDQAYSYDGLDRVIDTDQGTANNTTGLITTKKFEQNWKLDQLGNWEEFDQDDNGNGTWDLEQSRTHNDVNELTAVGLQAGGAGSNWADPAFDAAGNMTTIPQPAALTSSYTAKYDAWNRLVSLDSGSTASYEYDGLHRRIKRTESSTTRHFYYNESWQVLEERATEGGDAIKQFVWGANYIDELVLRDRDADANAGNGLEERLYATQDALYNVLSLVNTSGSVQERFAYTPYGESTVLNADMSVKGGGTGYAWEHRYTGRRLDPVSGLQLNRHRYYHQQLGRWCSRDPIGYVDGWSLYAAFFAINSTDPTGTWINVWGNYCGATARGQNGGPIDDLDHCCMIHDNCLDKPYKFAIPFKCFSCDSQLCTCAVLAVTFGNCKSLRCRIAAAAITSFMCGPHQAVLPGGTSGIPGPVF